jgi:hypothetical protein
MEGERKDGKMEGWKKGRTEGRKEGKKEMVLIISKNTENPLDKIPYSISDNKITPIIRNQIDYHSLNIGFNKGPAINTIL